MNPLVILPLAFQLAVPLALLTWLALRPGRAHATWLMRMMLSGVYVLLLGVATPWTMVPWYLPLVYAAILPLLVVRRARTVGSLPVWPAGLVRRIEVGLLAVFVTGGVALVTTVLPGRSPGSLTAVQLHFPLRGGTYYVVNGGSNVVLNPHLRTLESERARPYRGQSYALDIVRVNAVGVRAPGLLPSDPARYEIFGDTVYAPCTGTVVTATDGLPDLSPPEPDPDRANLAGNHTILSCGGVWVVLAHLRRGSLLVRSGDSVDAGQPLGQVGNSGNTSEPHLHVHAQSPGTPDAPLGGEGMAMRFGDRFLFRNNRVRQPHR